MAAMDAGCSLPKAPMGKQTLGILDKHMTSSAGNNSPFKKLLWATKP